jgi:hypothetical protein
MPWANFKAQAAQLLTAGAFSSPFIIGSSSILEAKDWWADDDNRAQLESTLLANNLYGVVFGHQPDALDIVDDVGGIDQLKIIKIDSGMAPKQDSEDEQEGGGYPGHMLLFFRAADLNVMAPPVAYSLSATTVRRLPSP